MADAAVTYRGTVYPWQCDHMGHMNVMWYVGKFDEASWNFFTEIGVTPDYIRDAGCGVAAVQQNIAYRRELLPGDTVVVRSRLLELREKVIRFVHEMVTADGEQPVASCELTVVHLDQAKRKAAPFPERIAAQARALLAGGATGQG